METKNIFNESGIIITLLLIAIPVFVASILVIIKTNTFLKYYLKEKKLEKFNERLKNLTSEEVTAIINHGKTSWGNTAKTVSPEEVIKTMDYIKLTSN